MKFSLFSVSTPEYNVKETVALAKRIGFAGIEWRVAPPSPEEKGPDYLYHRRYWSNNRSTVDSGNVIEGMKEAKGLCDAAGLAICSMAYNKPVSDYEGIVRGMQAAAAAGCPMMRVDVPRYDGSVNVNELFIKTRAQLDALMEPAARYGVKLLLETHMDTIVPSASAVYRLICGFDPRCIGVIYDPGNMVLEGYEQYQMGFELLGDYLAHVHVKNARWFAPQGGKGWTWEFCPMDKGFVDIPAFLSALRRVGYNGWVSVEDFSNEDETEAKIRKVFAFLSPLLSDQ